MVSMACSFSSGVFAIASGMLSSTFSYLVTHDTILSTITFSASFTFLLTAELVCASQIAS
jgi:hypothetical protein